MSLPSGGMVEVEGGERQWSRLLHPQDVKNFAAFKGKMSGLSTVALGKRWGAGGLLSSLPLLTPVAATVSVTETAAAEVATATAPEVTTVLLTAVEATVTR